jgi:hypothetical protein
MLDDEQWERIENHERFRAPTREINPKVEERYFKWEGKSEDHPIPNDWLRHHAEAFHFKIDELLAARSTDFKHLSHICGVYMYFEDDTCLYVGKSVDVMMRAVEHYRHGMRWDSHLCFEVPPVHVETVEAYYIHRLRPVLNTKYPSCDTYGKIVKELGLDHLAELVA